MAPGVVAIASVIGFSSLLGAMPVLMAGVDEIDELRLDFALVLVITVAFLNAERAARVFLVSGVFAMLELRIRALLALLIGAFNVLDKFLVGVSLGGS